MEIKSLKTRNFKRLGTQEFHFTSGVNFISGPNGGGKSTVLRGIATAMFGVSMLPGHSDDVATWGQKSWSLALEFTAAGSVYVVTRSKSTAEVLKDGQLQANGNTPVTKYMEDLLGISAKDYNLMIHSRQGETAYTLTYGVTALQRKVEEFAGVEVVEKVEREAAALASQLRTQIDSLVEPELSTAEINEQVAAAVTTAAELQSSLDDVAQLTRPTEPGLTVRAASQALDAYNRSVAAFDNYLMEKDRLESWSRDIEVVEEPVKPTELASQLEAIRDQIDAAMEHNRKALRNNDHIERVMAELNSSKLTSPTEEELAELEVLAATDYTAEHQAIAVKQAELTGAIRHARKTLTEGKCDSCGTILADISPEDLQAQIKADTHALELLKEDAQELNRKSSADAGRLRTLKTKVETYERDSKVFEQGKADLAAMTVMELVDTKPLEDEREDLTGKMATYKAEYKNYVAYRAAKDDVATALAKLVKPELEPRFTAEAVDEVEKDWATYQQALQDYLAARNAAETIEVKLAVQAELIERLNKLLAKNVEYEEKSAGLQAELEVARTLSTYLRTKRAEYLVQVWDSVMLYSSKFLNETTRGWLEEVSVTDGKFMFREEGAWVPVVEASGAQAAFVGTAIRYGLNKALYRGKTFLAFDEPTEAMTEENARNLVAALGSAADQVLVITHKQSDQSLADNILEV